MPESSASREAELLERIDALAKENALLREKIDLLDKKIFGAKSEKLDPQQLLLLLQGLDARGAERCETDCSKSSPQGWSGSDIKSPRPVAAEAQRRSTANRLRVSEGGG